MSKYTTEVRWICEQVLLNNGQGNIDGSPPDLRNVTDAIEYGRKYIFNFAYPIFDNSYKSVLETKILRHYYTREIGFETVGLWKLKLETKLNEIMPYYNKLYESELLEFNPFYDVDYKVTGNKTGDLTENIDTDNTRTDNLNEKRTDNLNQKRTDNLISTLDEDTNETRTDDLTKQTTFGKTVGSNYTDVTKYSDTPQNGLSGVSDGTYLTNATIFTHDGDDTKESGSQIERNFGTVGDVGEKDSTVKNTGTQDVANTGTQDIANTGTQVNVGNQDKVAKSTDDYWETIVGKRGGASYSKLLEEYRNTFLNIDMMIIETLEPLFMQIW